MHGLPKEFLWGGATAANQCEGGYLECGKGLGTVDVIPWGENRRAVMEGIMDYHSLPEDSLLSVPRCYRYVPSLERGHPVYGRDGI